MVLAGWDCLLDLIQDNDIKVLVDGKSLRLAKVVAVARYGAYINVSPDITPRIKASSEYLAKCLARGDCIYGSVY